MSSSTSFETLHYQRHNQRRQEHLASLRLPIIGKSVIEVGAGIGDHTSFFLDRGCEVVSTDGRAQLLEVLKTKHQNITTFEWNVETPAPNGLAASQIVYAYGLLYHTANPKKALEHMASVCLETLLLETCVSYGSQEVIHFENEDDDPTQALKGLGCRPTRPWIFNNLKKLFAHVYLTTSQPWHEEFPIDWINGQSRNPQLLSRSVFVASRTPIINDNLSTVLLDYQDRH